jgi:hypothetical protein
MSTIAWEDFRSRTKQGARATDPVKVRLSRQIGTVVTLAACLLSSDYSPTRALAKRSALTRLSAVIR